MYPWWLPLPPAPSYNAALTLIITILLSYTRTHTYLSIHTHECMYAIFLYTLNWLWLNCAISEVPSSFIVINTYLFCVLQLYYTISVAPPSLITLSTYLFCIMVNPSVIGIINLKERERVRDIQIEWSVRQRYFSKTFCAILNSLFSRLHLIPVLRIYT